jgi:LPXTG-motif cell wall-anchored protein
MLITSKVEAVRVHLVYDRLDDTYYRIGTESWPEWTMPGVPAGTYDLQYEIDGQWIQADAITVTSGAFTDVGVLEIRPQIMGTVTDAETGEALPYARATAYWWEPSEWSADGGWWTAEYAYADREGRYAFSDLVEGREYRIEFAADGYAPQWWQGAASRDEATGVVVPASGADPLVLDAALHDGVTVTGTVVDAVTGEPVASEWVYANGERYASALTDENGEYALELPSAGIYRISLDSDLGDGTEIEVPAEGLTGHTLYRQQLFTIAGTVRDANLDVPLGNVDMEILKADDDGWTIRSVRTYADGTFFFELPAGAYQLRFENRDGLYVEQWYDGVTTREQAETITIVDRPVTGIEARLGLGGVARGVIKGPDGEPLAGATVGLATAPELSLFSVLRSMFVPEDPADAILGIETTTDENGRFELPPVDPGRYTLYVYTEEHGTSWYPNKATRAEAKIIEIEAGKRTPEIEVPRPLPLEEGEKPLRPEQTLTEAFEITRNPVSVAVEAGGYAEFTAIASGRPQPDLQWQERIDGEWRDLEGATDTTLSVSTDEVGERVFRAVFTRDGEERISREATLTVTAPVVAPGIPAAPSVGEVTTRGATVSWAPPAVDGGAPVTGYVVSVRAEGAPAPRVIEVGDVRSLPISGLSPATAYEVTVAARNSAGVGAASEPVAFTTERIVVPGAPVITSLEPVSPTGLRVAWDAPADTGGGTIDGYVVEVLAAGVAVPGATVSVSGTSATIAGLEAATEYTVRVAARNEAGAGEAASRTQRTNAAPDPEPTPTPTPEPTPAPEPTPQPERTETPAPVETSEPEPTVVLPSSGGGDPEAPDAATLNGGNRGGASVTSGSAVPGGTFTVAGLAPSTGYYVWMFSEPVALGWRTSDANGVVTLSVPASVAPGEHRVVFTDADGAVVAWAPVTVAGKLPDTGTEVGTSIAVASMLLIAGSVLLLSRRRARRNA